MFDNFQCSLIPQHCDYPFRSSIPFSLTSLSLETKLKLTARLKLDFKVEDGFSSALTWTTDLTFQPCYTVDRWDTQKVYQTK